MGFLLVQHELLRAKAKVNSLTYDQTRFKAKQDRIKKAIEKKELFYNKKATALENHFKMAKSNLTNALNTNDFAALGTALNVPGDLTQLIAGAYSNMSAQTAANISVPGVKENPNKTGDSDAYVTNDGKTTYSATQYYSLQLQQVGAQNSQMQALKSTYQTLMDQMLEALKEAAKEQLEEEKDMALLPLNEEDTDMETKITTNEAQITAAEEYAKSLKEKLAERIKDSTPKFGLG